MDELKIRVWANGRMGEPATIYNIVRGMTEAGALMGPMSDEISKNAIYSLYTGLHLDRRELYEGDGGLHPVFGPYYIKFGEYPMLHTNLEGCEHVGFYLEWPNPDCNWIRRDLKFWVSLRSDDMLFDMNIYQNPELLVYTPTITDLT